MNKEPLGLIFWLFMACMTIYFYDTGTPFKSLFKEMIRLTLFIAALSSALINAYLKIK